MYYACLKSKICKINKSLYSGMSSSRKHPLTVASWYIILFNIIWGNMSCTGCLLEDWTLKPLEVFALYHSNRTWSSRKCFSRTTGSALAPSARLRRIPGSYCTLWNEQWNAACLRSCEVPGRVVSHQATAFEDNGSFFMHMWHNAGRDPGLSESSLARLHFSFTRHRTGWDRVISIY